ncbi:flagellar hook-length control protein FliK [Cognatishimia maritima]|uniref:flagellar hook-length control protein FliK n=1 Tax=Cognatishimia maritima TaxID=870908 RepID=UPI0013F4ED20|nr:flagellar hook-length control protein FliK [Cognatishimia maritima]
MINPLLSMLGAAPAAQGAVQGASAQNGQGGGFLNLITAQLAQPGRAIPAADGPAMAIFDALAPDLEELSTLITEIEALVDGADLGLDVKEEIGDIFATLTNLLGALEQIKTTLMAGQGEEGLQADGKIDLTAFEMGKLPLLAAPTVVLNALQQNLQALPAKISGSDALAPLVSEPQLSAIAAITTKVQAVLRPAAKPQHPVAIAPVLEDVGQPAPQVVVPAASQQNQSSQASPAATVSGLVQTTPTQPTLPEVANANAAVQGAGSDSAAPATSQAAEVLGKLAADQLAEKPAGHVVADVAARLTTSTAGLVDVPREMTPVIPQEVASVVQASGAVSEAAQQVSQSARPDAPQTKFTQAVVGQLRSVEFSEGTTKVELNPRGLGNVEIEMKTNSDGSLSVVVRAESAHVLSSLRGERELLAQIIGQGGEASVDFQEFSENQQQDVGGENGSSGGASGDGGAASAEDGATATETATIGNGQLDLMT